jgi:hypothetical protein
MIIGPPDNWKKSKPHYRKEIGVFERYTTPKRVVRLILQRSVSPVAAGTIVGLLGMVATAHLLSAMLFDTAPFDPVTFCCGNWIVRCASPKSKRRRFRSLSRWFSIDLVA